MAEAAALVAGIAEAAELAPLGRGIAGLLEQLARGRRLRLLLRLDMAGREGEAHPARPVLVLPEAQHPAIHGLGVDHGVARHLDLDVVLDHPPVRQRHRLERHAEPRRKGEERLAVEHAPGKRRAAAGLVLAGSRSFSGAAPDQRPGGP